MTTDHAATPELTEKIDPAILWRWDGHDGNCCSCCEEYCPQDDAPASESWEPLFRIGDAIGSNKVLIHADALAALPDDLNIIEGPDALAAFVAPEDLPPVSTRLQSPDLLERLERAGIDRHDGADIVHLYRGGKHVGWCKWNEKSGVAAEQLPRIRAVAVAGGISLQRAAAVLELTDRSAGDPR
jgi:hypothetical protein